MSAPNRFISGDAPSVCVYCGSRFGADPAYRAAAEALAARRYLLARDVGLCVDLAAARYDLCLGR